MQRAGGIAGIVHAIAFIAGPVILALTIASLGLHAADMADPSKALPAILNSPTGFVASSGMYAVLGATILVLALAFDQRLRDGAPSLMRAATASGLIATAFFVAAGVLGMTGVPEIAAHYPSGHDQAGTAFIAFQAVTDGLLSAGSVAYGAWLVMACWAAIRVKAFSRGLNYFGFIWGIVAALAPFSRDLAFFQTFGVIWAIWIGAELLRGSATTATAARPVSPAVNGRAKVTPELPERSEA
jgi:hypothetical protein